MTREREVIEGEYHQYEITPRCRTCGRFMQLEADEESVLVYFCCGEERVVPKPNRVGLHEEWASGAKP